MKKRLRLGMVGVGKWGKNLVREFSTVADVACCYHRKNKSNRAWVKDNYPSLKIVSSYGELLKDPTIDAIVIATPIETHFDLAKEALSANKHVFVEKPAATSVKEVQTLSEIAERKKLIFFTGYVFLYSEVFEKINNILKKEGLQHIITNRNQMGTFNSDIYWNLLPHELSLAITLLGKPTSLAITNAIGAVTKADIVSVRGQFGTKRTADFSINRVSSTKGFTITFVTNKNTYLWEGEILYKLDARQQFKQIFKAQRTPLEHECRAFINAITKDKSFPSDRELSVNVTAAIEKLHP